MNKNLKVNIAGIEMKNPLMTASGTFGFGLEYRRFFDPAILGGIVVKAITPKPRIGNPDVRIAETPAGMLNAIGLENPGVDVFLKSILPAIKDVGAPIKVTRFVRYALGEGIEKEVTDFAAEVAATSGVKQG